MSGRRVPWTAIAVAATTLLVAAIAGLVIGPANVPVGGVLRRVVSLIPFVDIASGLDARHEAIVTELRLPRVVLGALVGSVLATTGAAYQGVFRNPLADPYLLGVAAGAGLGATVAIVIAGSAAGWVPLAAFGGGLLAVVVAFALGGLAGGRRTGVTLILAGVAVASFFTAIQTFVQQQNADTIREVFSWILGRLATAGWTEVLVLTPYAVVTIVVVVMHGRLLDALAVGESEASSLGVDVSRVRAIVVVVATLGTAAAVSVSGLIGFVGIVVPHTIRLMVGSSYRVILPVAAIGGAAFLVAADIVARSALGGAEIPIGVVTAFVGGPFFALVLRTSRRQLA